MDFDQDGDGPVSAGSPTASGSAASAGSAAGSRSAASTAHAARTGSNVAAGAGSAIAAATAAGSQSVVSVSPAASRSATSASAFPSVAGVWPTRLGSAEEEGEGEEQALVEDKGAVLPPSQRTSGTSAGAAVHGYEEGDEEEGQEEEGEVEDEESDIMDIDLDFEDMEQEFQSVLEELSEDPTLARFRMEYDKLHSALQLSHHNERRLMDKCRQLQAEIAAHSAEVATSLKLASEDKQAIEALKKEVEKAWRMVDMAHERETEARETMETLQNEITRLHELTGESDHAVAGQKDEVDELLDAREDLERERDNLLVEVEGVRAKLEETAARFDEVQRLKADTEDKLEAMTQELQVQRSDMQRETRRKERAERDLRNARADIGAKENELRAIQNQLETANGEIGNREAALKDQKALNEKLSKENDLMTQRLQKLQVDYEQQLLTIDQLAQETQRRAAELRAKDEEQASLSQQLTHLTKLREMLQRKQRLAEDQRATVVSEKEGALATIHTLERELEMMIKQKDNDNRAMDMLRHEKDLLKKAILKEQGVSFKQSNLIKLQEQAKKALELETTNLRKMSREQKFVVSQLEKERDKYINDAATLTQRMVQLVEEIKIKQVEIFDYRKKIAVAESKLKQQESLYEAVRSDRNMYSKNLIESQDEVSELKRKLSMLNHQIFQLKEESNTREALLAKEQNDLVRCTKEKETLQKELERMRSETNALQRKINELESENMRLNKVLTEAEMLRHKQQKQMNQVLTERDIVGTQLVRRNDELSLLYEKLRIQESTLSKGEQQYNERIKDMKLFRLEIKNLRREKALLNRSVHNLEDMRREMYHMHRALLKEQSKSKALENELQNPQNVHRWRRLEGNDPTTYEMILKIHTLQRRLIMKTEEATRKEMDIQEKERLYLELKKILQRQPGPEMAEQLMLCQGSLRQKTRQMKSLVSELNMYESQIQEYRLDIDRLTEDLKQVKKQYLTQKRNENRLRSQLTESRDTKPASGTSRFPPVSGTRGGASSHQQLGGGFKLAPIGVPSKN